MLDLTVIILTYNEEKHIERTIQSVKTLAARIIIVDSFSSDHTAEIAKSLNVEVTQRKFINQAEQFQWALDHLSINTKWVMKLDADEYLEPSLINEIIETLPQLSANISGIYIKRKVFFQGQWIKHGGFYPHTLLRIWKAGEGRVEQRWMDEHVVLRPDATAVTLKEHMVDDNLKGITFWINKHNHYASREMADILIQKYFPEESDHALRNMHTDKQARWKRFLKDEVYTKLPTGLRAGLYFSYRYFLRLGFLDGSKGFVWHFMQGFWYRLLVDIKLLEVEKKSGGDVKKIREILLKDYGIEI